MVQPASKRLVTEDSLTNPAKPAGAALAAAFTPAATPGRLSVVANNCYGGGADMPAQTVARTSRSPHVVGVDCSDLRFVYSNSAVTGSGVNWSDSDGTGNPYSIAASVEIGGTIYRLTFRGQATGVADPGGLLVSDPLAVELTAGTQIYSRTYINATSWAPNKASYSVANTGGAIDAADRTAPGSAAIADSIAYQYAPYAVIGVPRVGNAFAPVILGDSIDHGIGDPSTGEGYGIHVVTVNGGFWNRAFSGKAGMTLLAKPGDQAQKFAPAAGHFRRARMLPYGTHALVGYGRNDVTQGRTLAQIQADNLAIWNLCKARGLKVWSRTITPLTTSTDAWATVGNQTVSNAGQEAVRVDYNNWLRAGAPLNAGRTAAVAIGTPGAITVGNVLHPLTGFREVADTVESARDSGKWKAGYTADGTHPNAAGHTAMAAACDPTTF